MDAGGWIIVILQIVAFWWHNAWDDCVFVVYNRVKVVLFLILSRYCGDWLTVPGGSFVSHDYTFLHNSIHTTIASLCILIIAKTAQ